MLLMRNSLYLLLAFLYVLASNCLAETSVVARLIGLKDPLPKGIFQQVRVIDVTTGETVLASAGKARLKFKSQLDPKPSIMVVNHLSKKAKLNRKGLAALFTSNAASGDVIRARIKMRANKGGEAAAPSIRTASVAAPVRVGIPADGITVSGPGTSPGMASGVAGLMIVDVTKYAPCYGSGVVVIDVDPLVQAARENEFQLCSSGLADPSSCVADNYVAPDHSVRGSLTTDGSSATMTVEFVDPDGNVVASETETGSASDFLQVIDKAMERLSKKMCEGTISLVEASCDAIACVCCNGPGCDGTKWNFTYQVSAKGAVGSKVTFNLLVDYTQVNCGDWSVGSCLAIPCCIREEGQPESTTLGAIEPFPFPFITPNCICPPQTPTPVSFFVQLVEGENVKEKEQIVNCPQ